MADFCRQCGMDILGLDGLTPADLAGITWRSEWEQGRAASALCEGCGPIQVDPDGNCVSQDCMKAGRPGHGLPWVGGTNA